LLELIIVAIIISILATIGFAQYSNMIERSRIVEAIQRIGLMRQLTYEYYLKNGNKLNNMQPSDVGLPNLSPVCTSESFYAYHMMPLNPSGVALAAERCIGYGKPPDASRKYTYYQYYYPATGQNEWHCYYDNDGGCFGLTP